MLNYDPASLTGTASTLASQAWPLLAWAGKNPPSASLPPDTVAIAPRIPAPPSFQPERLAGLCAAM